MRIASEYQDELFQVAIWLVEWGRNILYSYYRGQTRSGSHGMEGVEDGLKYRGLRRWARLRLAPPWSQLTPYIFVVGRP